MNEKLLLQGEYFADYDEGTGLYCIFHTDYKPGHAFASYANMKDAEQAAEERNRELEERRKQLTK